MIWRSNGGFSLVPGDGGVAAGIISYGLTFDSDQHQLWAATNVGVYRSGDAGTTWQALNNGLPADVVVINILPASINGGDRNLVFAGTNHGFFRSQDTGAHWSTSQESLSGTSVYAILIDYHQVTTIYVGIGLGVLRSDDNGQNWGGVASGLPKNQPAYALASGGNGYNQLYAAANDVYLFPGHSSVFDPSQLFPVLLIVVFFFALYCLSTRARKRSRQMLKSERVIEAGPPSPHDVPRDVLRANAPDKTRP